jgi:hypothetical protein
LRQRLDDGPDVPTKAEIGWMLSDHGLDDLPPLPPDVARRLEASE